MAHLGVERAKSEFPARLRASIGNSSIAGFAKKAGLSTTALRNYLDGSSIPKLDNLVAMARLADVTVGWLAAGEVGGEKGAGLEPMARVPIYAARLGASEPGAGGEPTDEIVSYGDIWVRWLRDEARVEPARAFIAQVQGYSMLKLFADGDLVIGEVVDEMGRDATYALYHDDELFIKHVRRHRDGIDLISENPAFPPKELRGEELDPDRFRLIGRVAGRVTGHIQ